MFYRLFSIGVVVLGFHRSKNSSTDMTLSYELFGLPWYIIHVYRCVFKGVFIYEGELKSSVLFFSAGIITDTGTCIIHQNKAGPLWITSLLLNIVIVSLNSNVPPSNESMYLYVVKFCWLFFEPLHRCSFHFLVNWHNVCFFSFLAWNRKDDSLKVLNLANR